MIILISGRMGSGKDTVGSIIQYLTEPSNNTTYKEWLANKEFSRFNPNNWKIKKFADKLKDIACMMIGCTRAQLEDQEFKKTLLGPEWNNMSVREFLQKLGTEAMRNGLHENVWVNSLMADYKPDTYTRVSVTYIASNLPNWIITDTRFPNELAAVKSKEGVTIRVVRPNKNYNIVTDGHITRRATEFEEQQLLHPSETALDDATFDYEIVNDGTIEELIEKVRAILIELSII
jgi:cytidylate kinase